MNKITLISKKLVFTIVLLFITFFGISQTTQTFSTSGTFTVPAGVTSIQVEAWGGGGAGGGATGNPSGGGGGAGGGYVKNTSLTVIPGTTYTVTVGTGGLGSTGAGGAGNSSWFGSTATLLAVGGNGGNSASGNLSTASGATASTSGNIGWSSGFNYYGGAGGTGVALGVSSGGGGGSAGTTSNGNSALIMLGGSAVTGGGAGATGLDINSDGNSSAALGGAGAGARAGTGADRSGGNGYKGQVIISWTCPTYSLTSTLSATPICPGNTASASVTSSAAGLPLGIYTVTYNLTGANSATGNTATMTVTSAGTGSFTTSALSNSGTTTITITNLASGGTTPNNCSSNITTNNTANITVNATPTITGTTPASRIDFGTVDLGATASAGTISWYAAATGENALGTGSSFTTPVITTTTTYYVETTNNSCTSSPRIAVVATVNLPEINIIGNAVSIIDGDLIPSSTDWTDFGSMETSTGIITKTYTIQNAGTSALSIGVLTISGTNAGDFTLTTSPSASIPAGDSTTFSVSFNPNTLGLKTAAISIVNNDANENPYDFSIQGTGIQTFYDSDGDGVYDNFDIDDDNDGIQDATEEANCNSSNGHKVDYKFLNETFGTGGRTSSFTAAYNATTTYCYEDGSGTNCPATGATKILDDGEYTVVSKITGATAGDPDNIHGDLAWYNGEDHTTGDTNGRMAVFNASFTPGTFYETTITGVLSNLPITYSFWVLNIMAQSTFPTSILPNVTVEFYDLSNNLLTTFNTGDIGRCSGSTTDNTCAQGVWKQFTTSVNLGNVNAFTIRFKNNAPGGGGNDLALDDILISQTLCDLDHDGVADMFDLDADNDGIEDVIEAGLGNLSNAKGKIDVSWVDTNGNGLHDSGESVAAIPALDSDGDGVPNYIDLDSDNDSLFDVDESGAGNTNAVSGYQNGDGDINGDGVGDGIDSETFRSKDINGDGITEGFGDGILDMYDYGTGVTFNTQYGNSGQGIATANPATTYLKDTDADGIPDYLDLMSNGSTFDIANTLLIYDYKTLDTNNNGIIDGTTDIDKDGILDIFDTNTTSFGSPRDIRTKLFLDFDGRNDYGQSTAILGGLANASLMAWINLNPAFSSEGVIVGQNNFQIRITAGKKLEAVVNGTSVLFNTTLNVSQWYNVGVIYDGSNIKLYLNGALVTSQAKTGSIPADASLFTLGKDPSSNTKYFKGKIDEVRVFNLALTESQLQRMVYQEIQDVSSQIRGMIVPKNVASSPISLPFTNLLRYYRMDNYKDDIIDDLTTPAIDLTGTKIYNHKNIHVQQAPMPFLTERNGSFATAVNSPTKEIRGEDIMEQDWSIVHIKHDITETANTTDLGMLVDSGKNIVMNNDTKIQNDWYLKLDGKIDLAGMSQLVQTAESDLDVSSTGWIERDQQGQSNVYNYNYWSSPVSPINSLSNNNDYSINEVFKDGTNVAVPKAINWVGGYDGAAGSPISLARYWLYKFDDYVNDYANWVQITENDLLRVGQGFTLKGSGSILATQNYTFIGKPNNGSITTNTVGDDQLLLTGNPYPSALDADAFITDNINSLETFSSPSIDGTLYFWEHYASNKTHILRDYQGGYAVRNLTGGLAPSASGIDFISQSGTPSKGIPNRYIPVGQGFFVNGKIGSGGMVVFKNSQRGFHKENDALNSNEMYKTTTNKEKTWNNNNNDSVINDTYKRIRLGFNSHNDYHRQVLLGFMNEKATSEMDNGYDGLNIDDFPNDMYFLNGENQLVIQGEGFFDADASYSIGVKTDAEGKVKFLIDALENFDSSQPIFLYDDDTKTYHNIRNEAFEINLTEGEHNSRFSLRFKDKTLSLTEETGVDNVIKIAYSQSKNTIIINNKAIDTTVQEVTLFNTIAQSITTWKIENQGQYDIQLPIKKISSGVYIVKLKTSKGDLSKKIIIK